MVQKISDQHSNSTFSMYTSLDIILSMKIVKDVLSPLPPKEQRELVLNLLNSIDRELDVSD